LLKEEIVLEVLEDQLANDINKLIHAWHCSAARSNMWDEKGEDFEFHRKEADKSYKAIGRLTLPWYNDWAPEKSLKEMWDDFKAVEKDPEFQKWRVATKAEMKKRVDKAVSEQAALETALAKHAERQKQLRARQVKHVGLRGR
jgi:hypothetical protein